MLKNNETLELFDKYIESYGENGEVIICIEEMSELTKELAKYIRYKNYQEKYESNENLKKLEEIKENIIEECADVLICASQIRHIFGEKEVDEMIEKKLQKGKDQLEKNIKNSKIETKVGAKNEKKRL